MTIVPGACALRSPAARPRFCAPRWGRPGSSTATAGCCCSRTSCEEPYRIDRLLTQLGQAGKLAAAAGFVVSEHHDCAPRRPERSQSLMEVLRRHLEPLGKPCLYGLPLGHGEHLASVPLGVPVELDADEGVLTI